jgi:hypothetical protein
MAERWSELVEVGSIAASRERMEVSGCAGLAEREDSRREEMAS